MRGFRLMMDAEAAVDKWLREFLFHMTVISQSYYSNDNMSQARADGGR
jgi:hypothetical protein